MSSLSFFVGTLIVAYLVPGADMILLLRTASTQGVRYAFVTAAGLGTARALHVTLAAIGLASLLAASPPLFRVVRLGGALYLFYLGLKIACAANRDPITVNLDGRPRRTRLLSAGIAGFVTNVSNPKSLLFCSVLLPQFIVNDRSIPAQFAYLGTILVGVGAAFDTLYCVAGQYLGRWIVNHPKLYRAQQCLFAVALIALSIRLATLF